MFAEILAALARKYPLAERLAARAFSPTDVPAYPVPITALAVAPNRGAGLVIRGVDGVYAVTHRVTLVGTTVIVLASVFDTDGEQFRPSVFRDVRACLPGVSRAARVAGRWSIGYPADAEPIRVDPFPARTG